MDQHSNHHLHFFFTCMIEKIERTSHIIQIAAVSPSGSFSCYVKPKKGIESQASNVTGITFENNQMYHQNQPVKALLIKDAMTKFFSFIGSQNTVMLVGHNVKVFDCYVLSNALRSCGMLGCLDVVGGYLDTLVLFRSTHADLQSFKQESIYQHLVGKSYDAHNALCDVQALNKILEVASIHPPHCRATLFNPNTLKKCKYTTK